MSPRSCQIAPGPCRTSSSITLDDILGDPDWMQAFLDYLPSKHAEDSLLFLVAAGDAMRSSTKRKLLYQEFIQVDAPKQVQVDQNVRDRADYLAHDKKDWKNAEWQNIIRDIAHEMHHLLSTDFVSDFQRLHDML